MDLPNPVYIGDTISLELEVTETKELSRDDPGLVVLDGTIDNQDGTVVFEGDMSS